MTNFNDRGEINALSHKDALEGIAKYARILQDHVSSNQSLAGRPGFNEQQKDEMIKRALLSTDGKIALGQAMALPIRRNLN